MTFNAPMESGGYLIGNIVKIEIELEAVRSDIVIGVRPPQGQRLSSGENRRTKTNTTRG